MKIAIIGYGRMGKEIHQIAKERNHQIELIIDQDNSDEIKLLKDRKIDVAIEFTLPDTAKNNIEICLNSGIPVVSGTTGWGNQLEEMKALSLKNEVGFLYASNFSIGMNVFFAVNKYVANIMNKLNDYNVDISETHHTRKLDKPSGTAITLAEQIIKNIERKNNWDLVKADKNTIKVEAIREADIPGIHHVKYNSDFDEITLSHSAKSRKGFALGAVLAAEFIADKQRVYEMKDVMESLLKF